MPILFNQSNSDTLLSIIKQEAVKAKSSGRDGWVFYIITCYFKEQSVKKLVGELKNILTDKLAGIHILVDVNEWIKSCLNTDNLVAKLDKIAKVGINNIYFTPVSYNSKLFHAKSYALINSKVINDENNGFVIITSGNATKSGLSVNIEIGQVVYDINSLTEFLDSFLMLQDRYAISPELDAAQKQLQFAAHVLGKGVFYHQWRYKPDLKFRLELSSEEKERLEELVTNEETRVNIENFRLQKIKTMKDDPINIQSIFKICPKPIPSSIWGLYSIDTPLGQWVPLEISTLIEDEVKQSRGIFIPLLEEKREDNARKIKRIAKDFHEFVQTRIKRKVLEFSPDTLCAVSAWEKRVKRFFADYKLMNIYISGYEKFISSKELDQKLLVSTYQQIKEFYHSPKNHKGLGRLIASLENDTLSISLLEVELFKMVEEVEEKFRENRLNELYYLTKDNNENICIK